MSGYAASPDRVARLDPKSPPTASTESDAVEASSSWCEQSVHSDSDVELSIVGTAKQESLDGSGSLGPTSENETPNRAVGSKTLRDRPDVASLNPAKAFIKVASLGRRMTPPKSFDGAKPKAMHALQELRVLKVPEITTQIGLPEILYYNTELCDIIQSTALGFDVLRKHYLAYFRTEGTLPRFLHELFMGQPSGRRRDVYNSCDIPSDWNNLMCRPDLFSLIADPLDENHFFLVLPNPTCELFPPAEEVDPMTLKFRSAGFGLCAWALTAEEVQPKVFEAVKAGDVDTSGSRLRSALQQYVPYENPKEAANKITTIWDLHARHIPFLRHLESFFHDHLRTMYGVSDDDNVDMFFHYPVAPVTASLHLHVRVNAHWIPFMQCVSFKLAEVIQALEADGNCHQLILGRGTIFQRPGSRNGIFWDNMFADAGDEIVFSRNLSNPYFDPALSPVEKEKDSDER